MVEIVGIMRFSVVTGPSVDAYKRTRGRDLDYALQHTLDPVRLRRRFEMACAMPIASLAGQIDQDFRLFVLVSTEAPDDIISMVRGLERSHPFLTVKSVSPDEQIAKASESLIQPGTPTITFRLDDDDAVNEHFVADLRSLAVDGNQDKILSCPNGLYMQTTARGFLIKPVVYPDNAYGLAYFTTSGRTIHSMGPHSSAYQHPMVLHPRADAWIRSIHPDSDSRSPFKSDKGAREVAVDDFAGELPVYRHVEAARHYRTLRELEPEPTFMQRMAAGWSRFIRS